ncbi:MAG: hypothetical protein IKH64_09295, partial [Prevotella sp.]|nr:hypothetical protein [Prevotella sp.]
SKGLLSPRIGSLSCRPLPPSDNKGKDLAVIKQILHSYSIEYTNLESPVDPRLDCWAKGPLGHDAIRGREQQLIDYYGGIGNSKLGNKIRGVSKSNIWGRYYHNMSNSYFGNIAPYTGY